MDPVAVAVIASAALVIIASIVARVASSSRARAASARSRSDARRRYGYLEMQQQELDRLATRIIATSSTNVAQGFTTVRQIEAVFTDGHLSPARAVLVLKALAAEKGANAILNIRSERAGNHKCSASGDAVMVEPNLPSPDSGITYVRVSPTASPAQKPQPPSRPTADAPTPLADVDTAPLRRPSPGRPPPPRALPPDPS